MIGRKVLFTGALTLVIAASATLALEGDARACGGCFGPPPPPTESPTIVTDHRMILTISKDQTTLYDQIRYQGSPSSFAWVLPISGTVDVGLSSDVVFSALDQATQTQIIAPPQNCPQQPQNCQNGGFASSAGAEDAKSPPGDVTVTKREVVGPYDTVQLHTTNPAALNEWLADNGFVIPADVTPVITQYVTEHFDFLALKLIPGKGIQDMRPVRVTSKGASPVLPLRMVAAGTGPTVGISLWLLAEGRYEPQNFPSFAIKTEELVWDWNAQKSNYVDLRAARTTASGGRGWEIESSMIMYPQQIETVVTRGGSYYGADPTYVEQQAEQDYLPVKDANGVVLKTAVQARQEDLTTLFYGIPTSTGRVTRLRADLSHAALDADLVLTAAADQATMQNIRQVTKELNEPLCPVFNGCTQEGTAPRSEAVARSTPAGETFTCTTTPTSAGTGAAWLGASGSLLALVLGKIVRRRRAR